MLSARSKIAADGTDSVFSQPTKPQPQSGYECAAKKTAKGQVQLFALAGAAPLQADACADSIDQCHDPVKYLGANGNCACFACEYGKSTQHNVCTQKETDKDILLRRSK